MGDITVDGETAEITVLMNAAEAEAVTEEIRQSVTATCYLVKEAHDKQAWKAMGYGSYAAWCKAEFDYSKSYAYRLVGHVNKILELSAAAGLPPGPQSPIGDKLPEGATRDLDMGAAVDAVEDAVADLPDDASDEDRATAVLDGVSRARARREAEAEKPAPPEPRPCSDENCQVMVTADHGMCPFHRDKALADEACAEQVEPEGNPPAPSAPTSGKAGAPESRAAATRGTEDDADPSPGAGDGGTAPAPPVAAPSLPCDWRERLANACYLIRLDPTQVADSASPDDDADLCALTDWCFRYIQAKEQNT